LPAAKLFAEAGLSPYPIFNRTKPPSKRRFYEFARPEPSQLKLSHKSVLWIAASAATFKMQENLALAPET